MKARRTVLVTGANGFIGRETIAQLARDGWNVLPAMRQSQKNETIVLDLESPSFSSDLKALPKVDAIVHLAARVAYSEESLGELFSANVAAVSSLVLLAKEMDAFFLYSSAALISGTRATYINHESPDSLNTDYMRSKWLAEQLIKASGIRYSILRIGGVFGLDGPEHLGLNRAIKSVVNGQRPIQMGNGNAKRSYIYVKDVAKVITEVLKTGIEGTHLVAGSEANSISEMLAMLCDVFNVKEGPAKMEGSDASDQIIISSDSFQPARSFRDAVIDMKSSLIV